MHRRFIEDDFKRRFVCLTFEDGYKDFLRWAYPLLRKYELPFAMYVATGFPDRIGELWWIALETVIAQNTRVGMVVNGKDQYFESAIHHNSRCDKSGRATYIANGSSYFRSNRISPAQEILVAIFKCWQTKHHLKSSSMKRR